MDTDVKIRNKTYEQYREELKPDIYAEVGEIVKCQGGHQMGTFVCTAYVDDDLTHLDIEPTSASGGDYMLLDPTRCICGNPFAMIVKRGVPKYSTVIRFWIDDQWRVRKYNDNV